MAEQAGGLELSPIAAELTYGLERIAMVLQKVTNVYDMEWAPGVKYGDVRHRDEVEQSRYAFGQVGQGAEAFAAADTPPVASTEWLGFLPSSEALPAALQGQVGGPPN